MKKLVIAIALSLSLGACAQLQKTADFLTTGVTIPVKQQTVDTLNASWGAALAVADGYREACVARVIPPSCRTVVKRMQAAAGPIHAAVKRARMLALNPNINATEVIRIASDAVNDFKILQMEMGVK